VNAAPFDRHLGELALDSEMTCVGFQKPVKGFYDPFCLRWCQDFDLDQVIEEMLDRTPRRLTGRIAAGWVREMGEIGSQKSAEMGLTQLVTAGDALLQKEAIELATLGKQFTARVVSVAFGLEVGRESVEMRSEEAAAEIDQGSFLFEPEFEHKN